MLVPAFGDVSERLLFEAEHFVVFLDGYPVSPGHSLIVAKVERATFFDLSQHELSELPETILRVKQHIETEFRPDGYNIGMNCGHAAGQTVMQFHCHVIPRFSGDMADPAGGIRHCIPSKGRYKF